MFIIIKVYNVFPQWKKCFDAFLAVKRYTVKKTHMSLLK